MTAIATYHNFDLLLTRAGERYKAIVVDAPEGEASALFDLPFAPADAPRLSADGPARGTRDPGAVQEPGPATDLADVGRLLFETILPQKLAARLAASQASVSAEGAGLRLRLRFEEDAAELALLPWETLYDPDQGRFVALSENSPVLRYLALSRARSALLVKPPLRVLAVLASPPGLPPLDVDGEWQAMQQALAGLMADGKFVLERLASPTLDALQQRLLGEPVHILHFIGHGVFDEASQAGSLAFADARNRPHLVRGDDLAKLLRTHPDLRLAYLNACEGALASGGSVFTGVAQALVREGVPAAVAMQAEISDSGAVELTRTFYSALAAGRPVDAALTQARVALSAAGSGEWAIPVLFSRSPDNRLFDIRQVLPTPDCPYPGMVPFSEAQKELFFGRDREIEEATARLRQYPFLAVIGASGSGKSSLINAGVIPALRKSRRSGADEWDIKTMRPSDRRTPSGQAAPMQALAELLDLTPDGQLPNLPLSPSPHLPSSTLLFVDQFEELFTLAAADEAQAFLTALGALSGRPNLAILLTARADFYPELMACALWPAIKGNRLELTPLGDDELWAAIVEPANRVGVTVDEALAVKLIADASGQKGVLPLVQETLVLLWDKVAERQLGLKAYQAMAQDGRSGLQVAIDRRASIVYDNLPAAAQAIARRIFLRLVQFGEGRADTRRQQTAAELRASSDDPALFEQTLAQLTASRLLTASGEAGDPNRRIDIAHEALIAGWPRLQEWLNQRRAAEGTRRRLEGKATEWVAAEKRGGLLDEYELQEAERWLASEDAGELGVSQALLDLVAVSKKAVAQAKTKEVEAERSRKRSRLFAGGLALAMLIIALVGYFALTAQTERNKAQSAATAEARARETSDANAREANTQKAAAETAQAQAVDARATAEAAAIGEAAQRAKAEAARVALSAVDQLAVDKERALLLAVYAARQDASMFTDGALRKALASPGHTVWFTATLPTEPVWSHSGRELLMRTAENAIYIRDMETGSQSLISSTQSSPLGRMAWSPDDAHFLIEVGPEVQVWSTNERRPVAAAQGEVALTKSPWNRDGSKILLRAQEDLSIWDWRADQIIAIDAGRWSDIAWSGDSNHLYTFSDGVLQVWQASDGAQRFLAPELAQAGDALWSPEDSRLLVIGSDGRLRVWNAADETTIELATAETPLPTPDPDPVIIVDYDDPDPGDWRNHVAWSPDGARILTAKERVQVWNADDGALVTELLDHPDSTLKAHWNPDGTRVLIDDGQRVRVVNVTDNNRETVLLGQVKGIDTGYNAVAQPWSPDGRNVMTVAHNQVQVWDADTGAEIASLSSEPGIELEHVVWSPTNDYVLGVNTTGQVRVWGLDPILKPTTINDQWFESWSPDGRYLVTSGGSAAGQSLQVWDTRSETTVAHLVASGHSEEISPGMYHTFPVAGWNHDGSRLVIYPKYNVAQILTTTDWQPYVDLKGHAGQLTDAAWAPPGATGDRLATASADGTVRIWNAATGETVHVLRGHMGAINDIDWSPDGAYIASAGTDGTVRIWHVDTGEQARVLTGHTGSVEQVHWNPQPGSPLLVSVRQYDAKDDHTRIWNAETGEQVVALVGDGSDVREAYWNATGAYLAAITDDFKVFLWQPGDWRLLPEADGDAAAWSPDGAYLAADKPDNSIIVWDAAAKAVVRQFIGHTGDVNTIDWDRSDGKRFISRGADGKVRHWSLDGSRATAVIDTDAGDNYAGATLSPDGRYVALWSGFAGVSVYSVQIQDLITIACRAAVRNLGPIDWREFIAPQNPQAICEDKPIPGTNYPDPRAETTKG